MPRAPRATDPAVHVRTMSATKPAPKLTSLPLSTFASTGGTANISSLFTEANHKTFPMHYEDQTFSITYDQRFYTPLLHRQMTDTESGLSRGDRTCLALEKAIVRWGLTYTVLQLDADGEPVVDEAGQPVTSEQLYPTNADTLSHLSLHFLSAVWEAIQNDLIPSEGEGTTSAAG